MGVEEWPQVNCKKINVINRNKDCEYDEKGRSRKGVMPYDKREETKSTKTTLR